MNEEVIYKYLKENLSIGFKFDDYVPTINIYLEDDIIASADLPIRESLNYLKDCIDGY